MGARTRPVPETVRTASNAVDMDIVIMVFARALDSMRVLSRQSLSGVAAIATRKHAQVENMRGANSFRVRAVVAVRAATRHARVRKGTLVLAAK